MKTVKTPAIGSTHVATTEFLSLRLLQSLKRCSIKVLLDPEAHMVRNVKLRRMGGSVGATLPKDIADRFHLNAGDEIMVIETALGILLSPYDPEVEAGLKIAAEAQATYRNALRELAE